MTCVFALTFARSITLMGRTTPNVLEINGVQSTVTSFLYADKVSLPPPLNKKKSIRPYFLVFVSFLLSDNFMAIVKKRKIRENDGRREGQTAPSLRSTPFRNNFIQILLFFALVLTRNYYSAGCILRG